MRLLAALLVLLAVRSARADATPLGRASWTDVPPVIDGKLDEPEWAKAKLERRFVERHPRLRGRPPVRTTFRVLVDRAALYVGVTAYQPPATIRARTLGRDDGAIYRDDAVTLKIDPTLDHRTTIGFATNPLGAKLDYRGIDESDFRVEFDTDWQVAAAATPGGWSAEFRIPWRSLGIDPAFAPERIGFDIARDHSVRNATYDWALLPPPFSPIAASRYGVLEGLGVVAEKERAAGGGGGRYALVPYMLSGFRSEDVGAGRPDQHAVVNAGFDATADWGRARGHFTFNTDFAQVDLDNQVVNLGRFGLFLPEKRPFFLQDLELLSFGVPSKAQMLYSRRIGRDADNHEVPILAGMKVVAQPSERVRVAALQVVTRRGPESPWTLHETARSVLELGGGSNAGVMVAHRQSLEESADHNVVVGVDGGWRGRAVPLLLTTYAMGSLTGRGAPAPAVAAGGKGTGDFADHLAPGVGASLALRHETWQPAISWSYAHPELRADLGFLQRVGVHQGTASLDVVPRFGAHGVEKAVVSGWGGYVASTADRLLDWSAGLASEVDWEKGFWAGASGGYQVETVLDPFTVGRATTIPAGEYKSPFASVYGGTPGNEAWSASGSATASKYYGGFQWASSGYLSWLPSPLFRADLSASYAHIVFDELPSFDSLTLNGRFTLGFTPRLGINLFTGFNLLTDLVQLQSRLRWIYARNSDLFLVTQLDVDDQTGRARYVSMLVKTRFTVGN